MTFKTSNKITDEKYKFELDFYSDIFKDIKIENNCKDTKFLKIIISKKENQYWPRLIREKLSFHWIVKDFVSFQDEVDDDRINTDIKNELTEFDARVDEKELYDKINNDKKKNKEINGLDILKKLCS